MKKLYFTITGTHHHYGKEFIEPGMEVKLVKEPDNEFDKEAIKVEMEGLRKTVQDDSRALGPGFCSDKAAIS